MPIYVLHYIYLLIYLFGLFEAILCSSCLPLINCVAKDDLELLALLIPVPESQVCHTMPGFIWIFLRQGLTPFHLV